MNRLRRYDKVAYVRFASVYLDFKDVQEFMTELKDLLKAKDKDKDKEKDVPEPKSKSQKI
jgi:transcriptional repressor NrdR